MKKGQICEGIVEYVDFPNKAVAASYETDSDGNEIKYHAVIKGALPGQTVRYAVKKTGSGRLAGRLIDVVKKSPLETKEPACAQFGMCGGCAYQTLPYAEQLKIKKRQVLKLIDAALSDSGNSDYIYDGMLESPDIFGYRNKMEFSFGDEYKGGPLSLGLHKRGGIYDIVDAAGCKIANDDYSRVLECVRDFFRRREVPHYNKKTHAGVLRHLLIRRSSSTGEMLVALATSSQTELDAELEELCASLCGLELEGTLAGFVHIINDSLSDALKCDKMRTIYGRSWITEKILGLKFKISIFSFFQTNTKAAEILYARARDYMTEGMGGKNPSSRGAPNKIIFDLYSGTGTIAQIMAPVAKKVIGIEIVGEAVEAARENAAANGLKNCEFIAGDVLKVLDEIEEKPDVIALDPPRAGIHPKAIKKIIDRGAKKIIYISCNPISFARDLAIFAQSGYRLDRVSNVDMFPMGENVETVCLLSKLNVMSI